MDHFWENLGKGMSVRNGRPYLTAHLSDKNLSPFKIALPSALWTTSCLCLSMASSPYAITTTTVSAMWRQQFYHLLRFCWKYHVDLCLKTWSALWQFLVSHHHQSLFWVYYLYLDAIFSFMLMSDFLYTHILELQLSWTKSQANGIDNNILHLGCIKFSAWVLVWDLLNKEQLRFVF